MTLTFGLIMLMTFRKVKEIKGHNIIQLLMKLE